MNLHDANIKIYRIIENTTCVKLYMNEIEILDFYLKF